MIIPEAFIRNITDIHGEKGRKWLNDLPALLLKFSKSWNLKLSDCYADASFNYVTPAIEEGGRELVVKCGVPSRELAAEAAALKYFNGIGAVRLLQFIKEEGVMLMEKIMPGHLLEELSDKDQATWQAITVMKKLHRPLTETTTFPSVADWFLGLKECAHYSENHASPFSVHLIDKALEISRELLSSMNEPVLLHGDLHYANMIWSEQDGYVAIDPKGVIGEREYEIPLPRLNEPLDHQQLQRQVDSFIAFSNFDRQRIVNWLFCKAVLAAWWTFKDSKVAAKKFVQCAEAVEKMLIFKTQSVPTKYDLIVQHNQQSYDQIANTWHQQREWYIEKDSLDQAIKYIRPCGKILDVGCGSGKSIAAYLLSQHFDVYGIDISAQQLKHATETIPPEKLWLGDIRSFQIPLHFDAILCWNVLFHVHANEHAIVLKSLNQLLNAEGILLVTLADTTVPPEGDVSFVDDQSFQSPMFGATFYHSGHAREINLKLIKEAGFVIIAKYCDQPGNHVILAKKSDVE